MELEKKCEYLKQQAIIAEEKEMQTLLELEKAAMKAYHNVSEDPMMVLSDEENSVEDTQNMILHLNKVVQKGKKREKDLCFIY